MLVCFWPAHYGTHDTIYRILFFRRSVDVDLSGNWRCLYRMAAHSLLRTHIVGLGPIGCLIAHHLRRALPWTHAVTALHRTEERATKAKEHGVIRKETSGVVVAVTGLEHEPYHDMPIMDPHHLAGPMKRAKMQSMMIRRSHESPIQSLIVCVKTYQTANALLNLYPRITPKTTIVLMQNGMGVYEYLVTHLFPNPEWRPNFVLASITHGARLKEYMHVIHTGVGAISVGIIPNGGSFEKSDPKLSLDDIAPANDKNHRHASLRTTMQTLTSLKDLSVTWKPISDLQLDMRRKVVVNSVINPLTALLNCQNGQIFQHDAGRQVAFAVCREASVAFRKQWEEELEAAGQAGKHVPDVEFPESLTTASLLAECERVAKMTSLNLSSMLVDVQMARDTEIQSMNGYLVATGRKYGVPMRVNSLLFEMIKLRTAIPLTYDAKL